MKNLYPNLTGTQGWAEFISGKNEMLAEYDKAKIQQSNRPIQVNAGKVAEAVFRKWLANFLPKKYSVTSGYIISQGFTDEQKLLHFDVIIYDQQNSPILWVENNADNSEQGIVRAIPAEYIHGILEVKTSMTPRACKDAIKKLSELKALLEGKDGETEGENYKKFLPQNFAMGIIFFELLKKYENDTSMLDTLLPEVYYRGYLSALVLRGEGLKEINTGRILQLGGKEELKNDETHKYTLLGARTPYSKNIKVKDELYLTNLLYWAASMFSMYTFDLLAIMNGTWLPGRASSMHGFTYNKT